MNWKLRAFCSNGEKIIRVALLETEKERKHYCWKKADGVIDSRFLSQRIGEVDIIHIVQTRNILGKEDKRI